MYCEVYIPINPTPWFYGPKYVQIPCWSINPLYINPLTIIYIRIYYIPIIFQ